MLSALLFPQPSTVQTPQGQVYEGRSFSGKGVGLNATLSLSHTISLSLFFSCSLCLPPSLQYCMSDPIFVHTVCLIILCMQDLQGVDLKLS